MGERTWGEVYPLLFSEHVGLRMATSSVAAFGYGLFRLIQGGFLYYDLYGLILSVILAPAAVLLFYGFFDTRSVSSVRRRVGFLSLAVALVFAAGDLKLYGISLAAFGCMFLTLYMTRKEGLITGLLTGTICGLAVSVSLAPLFAFGALAYGLFCSVSHGLAVFAALVAGLAWGSYVSGLSVLNGLFAALLTSVVLFAVWDKLFFLSKKKEGEATEEVSLGAEECRPLTEAELGSLRLADTKRRMKGLCESFSSLSRLFEELSRQMQTPTATDLRQICDRAFEASCASCASRSQCWGEQYRTTAAEVGALAGALHKNGRVERSDAVESLGARCGRLPDILEEINHNAAQHQRQVLLGDRTEVFALDYAALSELLAAAMVEEEGESACDEALGRALCRALNEARLGVTGVCVFGRRRRTIVLFGEPRLLRQESARISEVLGESCPFEVEEGILSEEREGMLLFPERKAISVSYAQRTLCADGEEGYCGDTVGVLSHADGRFFGLISDGMGSGREAALTSGISGTFLRKLLAVGCSCEMAVSMLNGFLRNRGSGSLHECSSTVDLMELDQMSSRASFYKSGAAPTYVFREGSLFKLRSRTVPVGILRETDHRRIGFDVGAGDVIVMVSDGVTQGKEECPWLFDLLRSHGEDSSPDRLADLIVKYAKEEGATDDLSVLIVKIGNGNAVAFFVAQPLDRSGNLW